MKRVAREIKAIEPTALHCYGHSLNLAAADTLNEVKPMADTLDHALEIRKLLKFSHTCLALPTDIQQYFGIPLHCTLRTGCYVH